MDFTKILTTALPWIGAAATGNVPALIAMAAKEVGGALGVTVEATPEAIGSAVANATPEQIIAMKDRDLAFQERMQAMGFKQVTDLEALAAGDRDSARGMQVAKPSPVPALLTCFVVGAFTATLILLLSYDVPATNRDIVVYMIGQLSGGFTSALAFWLGTTRDSGRKTELLAQAPAK